MKSWNAQWNGSVLVPTERSLERGTAEGKHWRGFQPERQLERNPNSSQERSTHSLESGTVERAEPWPDRHGGGGCKSLQPFIVETTGSLTQKIFPLFRINQISK